MKAAKSFILRYPAVFSIIIMLTASALTEIPLEGALTPYLGFQKASYASGILEQGVVSLLLVILVGRLGMLREAGFTPVSQWKHLWLIWPVLVFSLLNGSDLIEGVIKIDWSDGPLITLYVLLYVSVGFIEEILFRGLVLPLMLRQWGSTRKGIFTAVITSSMIFGLIHLVNFVMGRRDLLTTGTQILYGTFFGVFFAACFLRNRSIWPVIFGHFLFDLCGNFGDLAVGHVFTRNEPTTTVEGALITLALLLPLLLIGLFYLRKVDTVALLPDPVNV